MASDPIRVFDPYRIALIENDQELETAPGEGSGKVSLEVGSNGSMVIRTESDNDGFLVIGDTWYPGWVAKVSGEETPILRVNLGMRGIAVSAGSHTIELYFRPLSFYLGIALSLLGLLLVLVVAIGPYHGKRSHAVGR